MAAQDTTLSSDEWLKIAVSAGLDFVAGQNLTNFYNDASAVSSPYREINLAASPFNVVPGVNTAAQRAANTAAINSAISTYSGTKSALRLPPGEIFIQQMVPEAGFDNACVYFRSGTTDLVLKGAGIFSTVLVMDTDGDGGEIHNIYIDRCQRVMIQDLGLRQDRISNPDPSQLNHLIYVANRAPSGTATCEGIYIDNVAFFKAVGDGIFVFGDVSPNTVKNSRFSRLWMELNGTVTGGPYGAARNGISFQRGYDNVEVCDFFIRGFKNTGLDTESSGANTLRGLTVRRGFIDGSHAATLAGVSLSIGGVNAGAHTIDGLFEDITVNQGRTEIIQTTNCLIRNLKSRIASSLPDDPGNANVQIRQGHNDLVLENINIERTGGASGRCLDMENTSGNRVTIRGLHANQGTTNYPVVINGCPGGLDITDATIRYSAGSLASSYAALKVGAIDANVDRVSVNNLLVQTDTGTLYGGVYFEVRDPRTLTNVYVDGVQAQGEATNGVVFSKSLTGSPVFDSTPVFNNINAATPWLIVDQNDNPLANTIFPESDKLVGVQVLTAASGTYTPTAGTGRVVLHMVGGGGGGGGALGGVTQSSFAGGGSSGVCFEKTIVPGAIIAGGAFACGAGGAGGAATPAAGGNGGDTTIVIQGVTYTAKGGLGGTTMSTGATITTVAGGGVNAGSSSGDVTSSNQPGGVGFRFSAATGSSGVGGWSNWGAGGTAALTETAGGAAGGNGGGGGGAGSTSTTGTVGGAGSAGKIIVYEYA